MAKFAIDLTVPEWAYFFGFVCADGHMRGSPGHKGTLAVELSERDSDVLDRFAVMIPFNSSIKFRSRVTNFGASRSATLKVHALEFRTELERIGMPYGRKGKTITPPVVPFSERDYFRGFLDANGSIGITAKNFPFVCFGTGSPVMAEAVRAFVSLVTRKERKSNPTKREGYYNLPCFNEDAVAMIGLLYYDGCLAVRRKLESARIAEKWTRPNGMKRLPQRSSPLREVVNVKG